MTLRIAALQMCSGTEPGPNLDALEALVAEAVAGGARYVLSPEVTVVFAENREGLADVAGPWEGNPAIARVSAMAARHKVHLHLGSLAVALPDGRFANRSVLFSPEGEILATYDKVHLFDATLPGLKNYRESETYRGGDRAVLAEGPGVKLGLTICYDVRFPRLHRSLAEAGAQLIAVPAAFTVPTGEAHWHVLLRARAIETGCFVIAAAQAGTHPNGRRTYGHSMIIDPWGRVVAEADGETVGPVFADIDLAAIDEARGKVPALENARDFILPTAPEAERQAS
ncbi:Predicted amidohydrolase [Devosia enhydra]|uniref:Predicted amidohydrolase n=1 Tax=Devosia enhydra TaxID=665118 RepID=A0A1K2I0I6_9HYPH|nr:Predicted amidohydrolase [Devosia enhydra]